MRPTPQPRPQDPPRTPISVLAQWLTTTVTTARPGEDPEVTGISLSSQRIVPGDLYAALPGARVHGIDFAADAVAAGAVAVLTDPAGADRAGSVGVPLIVVPDPRQVLGRVSAKVYGNPAASLRMIGVTGTQGKTTTTRLLEGGLQSAGIRSAVIGTVGTRIDGVEVKTALTTPEAPDLHGLFALMVERGVEVCAMEVSSHALMLGRVDGVVFDVAVFLNLGRDHLDFHGTVEEYFAAKADLFTPQRARRALVNADDEYGRRIAADAEVPVETFSIRSDAAHWHTESIHLLAEGSTFDVRTPEGTLVPGGVPLAGDFNVSNALAAIGAAGSAGLDPYAAAAGISGLDGVPGRLERVVAGQDFEVVVDYAHKPDAVEAAISTLRPLTDGQVIVVLGAGGDRDPGKRPLMAAIAARLADLFIITDDNPRTEDPAAIRAAMAAGIPPTARAGVVEIGDRHRAIATALDRARPGDIVLIAGKGHEAGQEIHGVIHPFDDREVVRQLLASSASARPMRNNADDDLTPDERDR